MQKNNIQTGIWLIGIGVLALTNFWWPGIMFVIGLSALASGSVQAAIWLFGIGVLAWFDFWWPGILFLIGIGILAGGFRPFRDRTPVENANIPDELPSEPPADNVSFDNVDENISDSAPVSPPSSPTPQNWLPSRCPACGAPLLAGEAIWHAPHRAECPYCHTQLKP